MEPDELTIKKGEIIQNVIQSMDGWYEGTLKGKIGLFPDDFVEILEASDMGEDVPEQFEEESEESENVWQSGRLQGKVGIFPSNSVHEMEDRNLMASGNRENARIFEVHHLYSRPVAVVKPNSPALAGVPTRRATCEGGLFYQPGNKEQASRWDTAQLQDVQAKRQNVLPEVENTVSDLNSPRRSSFPHYNESTEMKKPSNDILDQVRQLQLKKAKESKDEQRGSYTTSTFAKGHANEKPPLKPKPQLTPIRSRQDELDVAKLGKNDNSYVNRSASISGKTNMMSMIENMMKGHQTQSNPVPSTSATARNATNYLPERRDFISSSESKTPSTNNLPTRQMMPSSSYFQGGAESNFSNATSSSPAPPTPPPLSTKPNFKSTSSSFTFPSPSPPFSPKLTRVSSNEAPPEAIPTPVYYPPDLVDNILASKLFQRRKACIGKDSLDEEDEDEWTE